MTDRRRLFHATLSMYHRLRQEGAGRREAWLWARVMGPAHVSAQTALEEMADIMADLRRNESEIERALFEAQIRCDISRLPETTP